MNIVKDFRPLLSVLKVLGIRYNNEQINQILKKDIDILQVKQEDTGLIDCDSLLDMILDSTDSDFMPRSIDRSMACELIKISYDTSKFEYVLRQYLAKLEKNMNLISNDELMNTAMFVCILDDCIAYCKSGVWSGPNYKISTLETKYKARVMFLNKDASFEKKLNELKDEDKKLEIEKFYKARGYKG